MKDWQALKHELRFWFELTGIPMWWRKLRSWVKGEHLIVQTGDPIDVPDLDGPTERPVA